MKGFFIFLILCFFSILTKSQTLIVFKTIDDFLNNKGEKHEGYVYDDTFGGPGFRVVSFKGLFGKIKLSKKDNWGFMYKGQLYRFNEEKDPMWVGIIGKNIVYYENGYVHLKESNVYTFGRACYLSADIASETFLYPNRRRFYKNFLLEHPACTTLFDCFETGRPHFPYTTIRKCVEDFEKIQNGSQFKEASK